MAKYMQYLLSKKLIGTLFGIICIGILYIASAEVLGFTETVFMGLYLGLIGIYQVGQGILDKKNAKQEYPWYYSKKIFVGFVGLVIIVVCVLVKGFTLPIFITMFTSTIGLFIGGQLISDFRKG